VHSLPDGIVEDPMIESIEVQEQQQQPQPPPSMTWGSSIAEAHTASSEMVVPDIVQPETIREISAKLYNKGNRSLVTTTNGDCRLAIIRELRKPNTGKWHALCG
jgi:hypothetical protein